MVNVVAWVNTQFEKQLSSTECKFRLTRRGRRSPRWPPRPRPRPSRRLSGRLLSSFFSSTTAAALAGAGFFYNYSFSANSTTDFEQFSGHMESLDFGKGLIK